MRLRTRDAHLGMILGAMLAVGACSIAVADSKPSLDDQLAPFTGMTIRDITFSGAHITKDSVIRREIWSEEGKILDPKIVAGDLVRLENLSIFGSVVVIPTEIDGGVALDYEFTEMPWLIPYPAVAYSEENGFSIGAGVASPNLFGRDITLSAKALFGGTTTFNVSAEHPWITGNHVSAGIKAWHRTRDNVVLGFEETTTLAILKVGTYLGKKGRLRAVGGYYGLKSDRDNVTLTPDNHDDIFNGGVSLGYDGRNSWRVPHRGWQSEIVPYYFGGDANTWTLQFDVRRYQPLGRRHTLATGPLLSLQSGEVGTEIPSYFQSVVSNVFSMTRSPSPRQLSA